MTEQNNIYAALAAAQLAMGPALKTANNPHFKTKYADLSAVVEACLEALNVHGIAVIQPTIQEDGSHYVETRLLHVGGETLSCRVPLIVPKNDMQGYGSAVTYARRYGLMCMTGIAPEDDDGHAAAKAPPPPEQRQRREEPRQTYTEDEAVNILSIAPDLDSLQRAWADIPKPVQRIPAVIEAKDKRKAELTAIDDEIPYEGK